MLYMCLPINVLDHCLWWSKTQVSTVQRRLIDSVTIQYRDAFLVLLDLAHFGITFVVCLDL
jgi:hypothetical protein